MLYVLKQITGFGKDTIVTKWITLQENRAIPQKNSLLAERKYSEPAEFLLPCAEKLVIFALDNIEGGTEATGSPDQCVTRFAEVPATEGVAAVCTMEVNVWRC
jgi:hypothetical protein